MYNLEPVSYTHLDVYKRQGMDIGSTTIKCVVLDENDQIIYSAYERHYSHILEKTRELLTSLNDTYLKGKKAYFRCV